MPNHCKFVLHGVWHGGPRVSIRIGDELPIRVAGWVEVCGTSGALQAAAFVEKCACSELVNSPFNPLASTVQ